MVLDLEHAELAARLPHLGPHLRLLLERAGERALELFSDEVTTEHVLVACMRDESCAAYEVVEHAFADPETVELELTALCPGIMVVGSDAALPFSPRAVAAMERARAGTAGSVSVDRVFRACTSELDDAGRAALAAAGLGPAGGGLDAEPDSGNRSEPLFRRFEDDAKRALSLASKAAGQGREANIAPARLALGCLQADPSLGDRLGFPLARARAALRPFLRDDSRPDPRAIPPAPELLELLDGLEGIAGGADSLDLLVASARRGSDELRLLLQRHKISEHLLERARAAFHDPGRHASD